MRINKAFRCLKTITIVLGSLGVLVGWYFQIWQLKQSDTRHRDESYGRVLEGLAHPDANHRLSATVAVASYTRDSSERRQAIITLLANRLYSESELPVLEATVSVLSNLGPEVFPELVRANRRAQFALARSAGRYIGLKLIDRFPRPLPRNTTSIDFERLRQYELDEMYEASTRIAWFSWPFEEQIAEDATFSLNLQYLVNVENRPYRYVVQSAYDKEKNITWAWQASPTPEHLERAAMSIEDSARFLVSTSMAIERALRKNTGKTHSLDLSRIKLIRADLSGIDLSRSNLQRADLSTVTLSRANLSHSDLSGVLFLYTRLDHANLRYVNLTGADLGESQQISTIFTGEGKIDTSILPAKILGTVPFEEERLRDADFTGSNWWTIAEHSWAAKEVLQKRFPRKTD